MKHFATALLAAVTLAAAAPAQAQGRWANGGTETNPSVAEVCPVQNGSRFVCIQMSCPAETGLGFGVRYGGIPVNSLDSARVYVDRQNLGALQLAPIDTADGRLLFDAWDEARHAPLLSALRAGRSGTLELRKGFFTFSFNFSLSGSSRALGATYEACTTPQPVDDPLEMARAEAEQLCAEFGGDTRFLRGFFREPDLNNDGLEDLRINYGRVRCSATRNLFCSADGCQQSLWLANEDGGYTLLMQDTIERVRTETITVLTIERSGDACEGAETCSDQFIVGEDGSLTPRE